MLVGEFSAVSTIILTSEICGVLFVIVVPLSSYTRTVTGKFVISVSTSNSVCNFNVCFVLGVTEDSDTSAYFIVRSVLQKTNLRFDAEAPHIA